jgi:hypothetical protein
MPTILARKTGEYLSESEFDLMKPPILGRFF